jgi:hypothetical protein
VTECKELERVFGDNARRVMTHLRGSFADGVGACAACYTGKSGRQKLYPAR